MSETIIGYARCSTDEQDLTAQRQRLAELGVAAERIYLDHGLTGTTRARPGLDQALAAVRPGDTLVVPKLDLGRSRLGISLAVVERFPCPAFYPRQQGILGGVALRPSRSASRGRLDSVALLVGALVLIHLSKRGHDPIDVWPRGELAEKLLRRQERAIACRGHSALGVDDHLV
jgi:Resolvase, N terminal domain